MTTGIIAHSPTSHHISVTYIITMQLGVICMPHILSSTVKQLAMYNDWLTLKGIVGSVISAPTHDVIIRKLPTAVSSIHWLNC